MSRTRRAVIYYGGFAFRGGGVFMHAKLMRDALEHAGWNVRLITLESLPWLLRYLPHLIGSVLNKMRPPFGYYYKDRLTRLLYRRWFAGDVDLRIFEDIYLSWDSPTPSITLLHAVWSDNLHSISGKVTAVRYLVAAEERAIDAIRHPVVTVSSRYRDLMIDTHGGSKRLSAAAVVPLGLDLADFDNAPVHAGRAKSLVVCGSLEPRKNLFFLLDIFRQLHGADSAYRLTLIGDGPDRDGLERLAAKHALPVHFCGRLVRAEVVAELTRHTLYVHPSVKESFSFALLEAKLAGLTTVAYAKLEVPAEFIDVPVNSFEVADWLAAIASASTAVRKGIERSAYSSQRMMQDTLRLAGEAAESDS